MKYSQQEQIEEILARGDALRKKRERRITGVLTASATALMVLLVIGIGAVGNMTPAGTASSYGSFLLDAKAGGYVLVAVLAFALGVVITGLFLIRRRQAQ